MSGRLATLLIFGLSTGASGLTAQDYNQGYVQPQQPLYGQTQPPVYGQPQQPAYGQPNVYGQQPTYPAQAYSQPQVPAYQQANRPTVVPVQMINHRPTISLGGTVVPDREVTLSAQLPGRITSIAGTEGDRFLKGAELASLDDIELLAQRQSAIAALRDADAALRNAGIQYNRELVSPGTSSPSTMPGMGVPSLFDQFFTRPMGSMMGKGNPSVERYSDLYTRSTQIEQARNAYLRAQSQLEQIESKFRDAQSIAPFNGVIVKKLVEVGDTMQPGQPILEFADTDSLQIEVDVPARLMSGIQKEMPVSARLDISDTLITVKVSQIFPMADSERHTVKVKFDIPPGSPAKPGMYVQVMVPDSTSSVQSVLVVPQAAILERGSMPMVHVADENNEKQLRIVRLGEEVDAYNVSVLGGLKPGDFVFVDPSKFPQPTPQNWGMSQPAIPQTSQYR